MRDQLHQPIGFLCGTLHQRDRASLTDKPEVT